MGRLRQRLAGAGVGIETVVRRGYRLWSEDWPRPYAAGHACGLAARVRASRAAPPGHRRSVADARRRRLAHSGRHLDGAPRWQPAAGDGRPGAPRRHRRGLAPEPGAGGRARPGPTRRRPPPGCGARSTDLADTVELYRWGDGYAPYPAAGTRYFDDNAWLGLDFMQAHRPARRRRRPTASGCTRPSARSTWSPPARTPTAACAGSRVGGQPQHVCSTAPAVELALRLHLSATRSRHRRALPRPSPSGPRRGCGRTLASRRRAAAPTTSRPTADRRDTVWAYNQGTPVGADVLWFRRHRRRGPPRARPSPRPRSSLDHFGADDRLWHQPPAFEAIFVPQPPDAARGRAPAPGAGRARPLRSSGRGGRAAIPRTGRFDRRRHRPLRRRRHPRPRRPGAAVRTAGLRAGSGSPTCA